MANKKMLSILVLLSFFLISIYNTPVSLHYFSRASAQTIKDTILDTCNKKEKGEITSIKEFITEIYNITTGTIPTEDDLNWWVDLWENDPNGELESNLFYNTNTPIVGGYGEDSTRARTIALLIIRSQLSLSAEMKRPTGTLSDTVIDSCTQMEKGKISVEDLVIEIYGISKGLAPIEKSLNWWVDLWENDPNGELESNLFYNTNTPIVGGYGEDSTRARTIALLIIRSQLSLSAEMKRPTGIFGWEYPTTVLGGAIVVIVLLIFGRYWFERRD